MAWWILPVVARFPNVTRIAERSADWEVAKSGRKFRRPQAAPVPFRNRNAVARPRPRASTRSSAERWCDRVLRVSRPKASPSPPAPRRESCAVPREPCRDRRDRPGSRNRRQTGLARPVRTDRLGGQRPWFTCIENSNRARP
jgi:hypothetical protein